ncbi:cytochrome c oxidase assembly protein COX18, mitochondrial isoform X1 [Embiotoca jacksoni]|uniref:cytochrome c oxidase assembly protein COX18, mitochondrial isoform X1 n=1 Tax=Embiotoca jacksoni TaxID=100190 RepID=UPI003703A091
MQNVGGAVRSCVLQFSVRGVCPAVIHRKSPAPDLICSAAHHRTLPGGRSPTGVRSLTGIGGGSSGGVGDAAGVTGASGWYSNFSDSTPVHLCEHFLVGVQQVSGLPWWLNIVMATLSVRTLITLPLAAYQLVIISKVEALQAEITELAKRLRYEVSVRARERRWTEKQSRFQFQKNLRRLVSQLYIRDNCHPFKASLLVWVQMPIWISLSLALRNLSLDQSDLHDELAAGGALWFPDLTVPDFTWILPVCLGLTNLLVVEVSLSAESLSVRFPAASPERHQRVLRSDDPHCCCRPLLHGSVLVHLQSGRVQSQPPAALSSGPQSPATPDPPVRDSIQRPAVCFQRQILQISTWSTSSGVTSTRRSSASVRSVRSKFGASKRVQFLFFV